MLSRLGVWVHDECGGGAGCRQRQQAWRGLGDQRLDAPGVLVVLQHRVVRRERECIYCVWGRRAEGEQPGARRSVCAVCASQAECTRVVCVPRHFLTGQLRLTGLTAWTEYTKI